MRSFHFGTPWRFIETALPYTFYTMLMSIHLLALTKECKSYVVLSSHNDRNQ